MINHVCGRWRAAASGEETGNQSGAACLQDDGGRQGRSSPGASAVTTGSASRRRHDMVRICINLALGLSPVLLPAALILLGMA
ncbi:MAG TPA: hypothetical protein VLA00_08540 [Xanthobacteraceae bacterium]|nr:hypothetical protein [Xanthobacteraceae bacterium]